MYHFLEFSPSVFFTQVVPVVRYSFVYLVRSFILSRIGLGSKCLFNLSTFWKYGKVFFGNFSFLKRFVSFFHSSYFFSPNFSNRLINLTISGCRFLWTILSSKLKNSASLRLILS